MNLWFYYVDGEKYGPIDDAQLRNLVGRGVIVPHTPVETDKGIRGLAGLFAAVPPPFQGSNDVNAEQTEKNQCMSRNIQSILSAIETILKWRNKSLTPFQILFVVALFVAGFAVLGVIICALAEGNRSAGEQWVLKNKGIKYSFHWCPAGEFTMGSPSSEVGFDDESQHNVKLTRSFWMLETEVTQRMWKSVMRDNPSKFEGDDLPVEQVSWDDCQKYIAKLNRSRACPWGYRFSLPTEAQWEFACRAGMITPFSFGSSLNGDNANCNGEKPYGTDVKGVYLRRTASVGSYAPNAWGLYDMHGNVCEWCLDWYEHDPSDVRSDPTGLATGEKRIIRGGSWDNSAKYSRSACRGWYVSDGRRDGIGFRLVLVPKK